MSRRLSNRIINTVRGPLKDKIFFLHIPKCAGTSLNDAIAKQYINLNLKTDQQLIGINPVAAANARLALDEETSPEFSVSPDCSLRIPECLLLYFMNKQEVKYISGHIPFSEIAYRKFANQFAYVTVLRDPVERWISEYSFHKFKKSAHQKDTASMDIDAYLESARGKAQGGQYVLFLGGRINGGDYGSRGALRRAVENLQKFAVVGCVEDLGGFAERFYERFGAKLDVGRRNINPKPADWETRIITADVRRRIENICERDCEIYHHLQQSVK